VIPITETEKRAAMVMTARLKSVVYGAMNLEFPTVYNLNDLG